MTQPNIYFVNYYGLFKDNIQKIIVSNDLVPNSKYSKGKSLDKVIEMLSRDETGQYFHYPTFLEADKHFRNEDLCYMSNFTENYLRAIDYETVLITNSIFSSFLQVFYS